MSVSQKEQEITLLETRAAQGDAEAQFKLGDRYRRGEGVGKDLKKAVELYQQAANQGYPSAQCNLGGCYYEGAGVKKDLKKSVELYQQAANQGVPMAQAKLGSWHSKGIGVTKDLRRAVDFYQQAASQGLAFSRYALGFLYKDGSGVEKNPVRAALLFQASAIKQEYQKSTRNWLDHYSTVQYTPTLKEAINYYTSLLESEDPKIVGSALSTLAFCYQVGLGTAQDLKKAAEFYLCAVERRQPGSLWDALLHYKHAPPSSAGKETAMAFYRTLETPFSDSDSQLELERMFCLAYLSEYGAPYFSQNLFGACEKYQSIFSKYNNVQGQAEDSEQHAKEIITRAEAKEKAFLPLYSLYAVLKDIHGKLGFTDVVNPEGEVSRNIITSLIAEYAFEDTPCLNINSSRR